VAAGVLVHRAGVGSFLAGQGRGVGSGGGGGGGPGGDVMCRAAGGEPRDGGGETESILLRGT